MVYGYYNGTDVMLRNILYIIAKSTLVEGHCSVCYAICMAVYSQWCICIRLHLELQCIL